MACSRLTFILYIQVAQNAFYARCVTTERPRQVTSALAVAIYKNYSLLINYTVAS
jgi:hypothetical protein